MKIAQSKQGENDWKFLEKTEGDAASQWKPYDVYRESGVEWLGSIPASWDLKPVKRAVAMNRLVLSETTPKNQEILYLDIGNVDSQGRIGEPVKVLFEVAPSRARRIVSPGDTIISTVRTYLRAIAYIRNPPENLIVSTGFSVLSPPKGMFPAFVMYLALSEPFIQAVVAHSSGVGYPAINPSVLGCLSMWLPSLSEQTVIANFLDQETARIDNLIAEKEKLLILLAEKRTSLINHVVTKGLNPDVPVKDSGIPWLGQVPKHWKVGKLKNYTRTFGGGTPPTGNAAFWNGAIPWVSPKDMKSRKITDTEDHLSEAGIAGSATQVIPPKAVLMVVRSGILIHTLPVAINEVSVTLNQDMKAFVPNKDLCPDYLLSLMEGNQGLLLSVWRKEGATVESLDMASVHNTFIPLPPICEQEAIVKNVNARSDKISALVDDMKTSISLLHEHRASLITAAVTGKIDVRKKEIF